MMYRKSESIFLLCLISLFGCSYSSENIPNTEYSFDISTDIYDVLASDAILKDISDLNSDDTSDVYMDEVIIVDSSFDLPDISDDLYDIGEGTSDTGIIPELTAELIGFENVEFPPKGSIIFFNNWAMGEEKDSIEMISPDGSYRSVRLYVNRVWSFGVNSSGDIIVFSTNDPFQFERYGLNVYDAIQNTWLLKNDGSLKQITFGAVNDECHTFVSDELLMMCRRANFRPDPEYLAVSDPYRILFHNLSDNKEEFLTPLNTKYNDYSGSMRGDGVILFNRNIIADRTIDIMSLEPKSGEIMILLEDASGPIISNDGSEVLFKKKGQNKLFLSSSFDLSGAVAIIDGGSRSIGRYVFSPDGLQVAYTLDDRLNNCADLMIASRDGSEITKILDCSDEKKFITVIRWVKVE